MSKTQTSYEALAEEIIAACNRHIGHYKEEVVIYSRRVENEYKRQVDQVLKMLAGHEDYGRQLTKIHAVLREYLYRMEWVGWCDCEFGPPLAIRCADEEYALSILVYLSARLIDDSIDGHTSFKGLVPNLYGYLATRMEAAEAAEINGLMGGLIYSAALRKLYRLGYAESADLLLSVYSDVFPGALAEAFCAGRPVSYEVYQAVVRHKAVAYDMMLHRVFFRQAEPGLRAGALRFLAEYSEAAQWLNDLCDEKDDRTRGQMNILNCPGQNAESVFQRILASFQGMWESSRDLFPPLRDVMAVRLFDSFKKFLETTCDEKYKKPFRSVENRIP